MQEVTPCSSAHGVSNARADKGDGTGQAKVEDRRAEQADHTTGNRTRFAVYAGLP